MIQVWRLMPYDNAMIFIASLAIFLLLICSALLSGSETGMTGASTAKLSQRENDPRARRALDLQEHPERWISALLIGNNLVNILSSALATYVFILLFGDWGVIFATALMTALVVIFAEVLPKSFALRQPEAVALAAARPLDTLSRALGPLISLVQGGVQWTLNTLMPSNQTQESDEEELRGAIDLHGRDSDQDNVEESSMLASILDLDDMTLQDIWTHRSDMIAVDRTMDMASLVQRVLDASFTRLPVYDGTRDHIIGLIHAKNLLRAIQKSGGDLGALELDKIMSKPWFVLETTSLLDQLRAFRSRREHFAFIIDEYGSMQGIVTLEDILEQIVGDIDDEYDVPDSALIKNTDGSYDIDGDTGLRTLNRQLKTTFSDEKASTLAGYLLYETQEIPAEGQTYVFDHMSFKILERKGLQITKIRISPAAGSKAS